MLLGAMILLASCAGTGGAPDCSAWRPMLFSGPTIDAMTPEEARMVLAHNLTGRRICDW